MRRRMRRLGRGLRGLGAVEGEKVEYFLPASIFNKMAKGAKDTIAFCMKDVEQLVGYVDYQAALAERKAARATKAEAFYSNTELLERYAEDILSRRAKSSARTAKTKAKASGIFAETAAEIRKDVAAIRAQGITGPIPVCIYRTTGKHGGDLKTAEQRANRHHERFHADTRREEYKAGREPYACDSGIASVLGTALDPALTAFSRKHWVGFGGRAVNEEILARVEEVSNECGEGKDGCAKVAGRINDWFIGKKQPELAASFAKAAATVQARFSSPLGVVKAACKVK